jgi:TRAP-type C4-dicarboxylate transport system permease small subunit
MARWLFSVVPMFLLGVLMLADVALNGANVIGRYFFGTPIFWAEEVMVYISIWGVFVGMVAVAYRQEHLCMDLFSSRLGARGQVLLQILITTVLAGCCLFTAAQSWKILRLFIDTGAVSTAASIPKMIPHSALLIGFALTAVAAVLGIVPRFKAVAAARAAASSKS